MIKKTAQGSELGSGPELVEEPLLLEVQHKGFSKLSFPAELEQNFKQYYIHAFFVQSRLALLTGLLVFGCFAYLDVYLQMQIHAQSQGQNSALGSYLNLWHYYFPLPILLILGLLTSVKKFKQYQQSFLMAMMLSIGFALILLVCRTSSDANDYYFMGLLILEILCFTSARMQFWQAFYSACILFVFYNIYYAYIYILPGNQLLVLNFFYISGSVLTLFGCYFIEHAIRKEYVNHYLLKYQEVKLNQAVLELEKQAHIDGLTQIPNRRSFDLALKNEWARCKRLGFPITLFMIDIDAFKKYNDFYGHLQGDECLKKIACMLKSHARRVGDIAARYGGEEFGVILPNTKKEEAIVMAKNILDDLQAIAIRHEAAPRGDFLTLSIGIATVYPEKMNKNFNIENLIHLADERLYAAKHQGGNGYIYE